MPGAEALPHPDIRSFESKGGGRRMWEGPRSGAREAGRARDPGLFLLAAALGVPAVHLIPGAVDERGAMRGVGLWGRVSAMAQDLFENSRSYLNRTLQTNFTVPFTPQAPALKSRSRGKGSFMRSSAAMLSEDHQLLRGCLGAGLHRRHACTAQWSLCLGLGACSIQQIQA